MATKNSKAKTKKKKADPAVTEASMALVNSQIKEGKFSQIYILTGDERFLDSNTYMHRLVNAICPDALKAGANNMNFSRYQGDNVDVQAIASDIQTLPFLSPRETDAGGGKRLTWRCQRDSGEGIKVHARGECGNFRGKLCAENHQALQDHYGKGFFSGVHKA